MDTATGTPRCETVDLTIPWTDDNGNLNVVKGDLIEENGQFEQINCVHVDEWQPAVLVRFESSYRCHTKPMDGLVKVFRYIETTEEEPAMTHQMTPEQLREDRIVSAYSHARVSLEEAAAAMKELLPQSPRTIAKLKKAQEKLDWYLSELEKAGG